jgi:hypothetical protein
MEETDKQYYSRRGKEERSRSRTATSTQSEAIHDELADLYHERANGSANVNKRKGIRGLATMPKAVGRSAE